MRFPTSDTHCSLSSVCSVNGVSPPGCIGAELTTSNVSVFITSDAGNAWRQVRGLYVCPTMKVELEFNFPLVFCEIWKYKLQ